MAKALERLLLLPKDMDGLRKVKQPELFLPLKRDLAMVSPWAHMTFFFRCSFFLSLTYLFVAYV